MATTELSKFAAPDAPEWMEPKMLIRHGTLLDSESPTEEEVSQAVREEDVYATNYGLARIGQPEIATVDGGRRHALVTHFKIVDVTAFVNQMVAMRTGGGRSE